MCLKLDTCAPELDNHTKTYFGGLLAPAMCQTFSSEQFYRTRFPFFHTEKNVRLVGFKFFVMPAIQM
jgi:hypothetical protein